MKIPSGHSVFKQWGICSEPKKGLWISGIIALLIIIMSTSPAIASDEGKAKKYEGVEIFGPFYPRDIKIDLRLIPSTEAWKLGDSIKEIPRRHYRLQDLNIPKTSPRRDPLLDLQEKASPDTVNRAFSLPGLNFDGQGFSGVNPPDTVGDVGKNYYIQAINGSVGTRYTIYNKSDGSIAAGSFTLSDLGGSGHCTSGLGDPIVLYDRSADRWLLSEFAPDTYSTLCLYISKTPDPIAGGWYHYAFDTPNFPDYPKYGVWSDAYYVGSNESGPCALYALDRDKMLSGSAATAQRFTVPNMAGFGFQMLIPADLDGLTAPPTNSPAYFMRHRDDEAHNIGSNNPSEDYLEIYEFRVDWDTPGNSSVSGPLNITVTEFDSDLCGLTSFNCFDQPGPATSLDPLREPVMWRLQYRNFDSHETLVGNFVTDVDGTDHGGIRWFELRKSGQTPWSLYQEGTYAPDSLNRWMGSIAMDGSGNIAVAYNVVDSQNTIYPGLKYAGRVASDTPGTLPQGENLIIAGSASNNSNRYGDYSAMSVDPSDDCTFWFTGMYNSSGSWSTRIASFAFDNCACAPPSIPANLAATANGDNNIDLSWSQVTGAAHYRIYRGTGSCPQPYEFLHDTASQQYSDTSVSGGTTYSYTITALNSSDCESQKSDCAEALATGPCTLAPLFDGLQSVTSLYESACGLQLSWNQGTLICGSNLMYDVYRSTEPSFTPGSSNRIAKCLDGTSYTDRTIKSGITYYYIVRAKSNSCTTGNTDTNSIIKQGAASGPETTVFDDGFESGTYTADWLTSTGPQDTGTSEWSIATDEAIGSYSMFCSDEGDIKDQMIVIKNPLSISSNSISKLSFRHKVNTESGYDGGVLEYSTDGGTSWHDILSGNGGLVPADSSRFDTNGYNGSISTAFGSPIGGRQAWTGDLGPSFIEVVVDTSDFEDHNVQFRWRMGCDSSRTGPGWWIDDIELTVRETCTSSSYPPSIYLLLQ